MFNMKRKAASLSKPLGAAKKPKSAKLSDNPIPAAAGAFPIVGIGASAGGLEAIEQFLKNVPSPSGLAFVIVQHLDPTHECIMAELLQRITPMKVIEVQEHTRIRPDCVYIIPPNRDLSVLRGVLHLLEPAAPRGLRLPIDFFFQSLAADLKERAVGVILSGMGTDGTHGLRAIKEQAGLVLVQDPASAKFDGMPRSAIDSGLVDIVAPATELAARILKYQAHTPLFAPVSVLAEPGAETQLEKIIILLRGHTGHDFSLYKRSTIYRRVERRMGLHQLAKLGQYVHYLRDNPPELELLFKELLIGVTNFFRDPAAWEQLRDEVLPQLLADRSARPALRAWVTGCSTGEEAYTLAMIFKEALDQLKPKRNYTLQIFATDIDLDAVNKARLGSYPAAIATSVSPERLDRFFIEEGRGFRVSKEIREMIIFAPQNLIMDPPFTKLDFLTCRNLLIYFTPELQKQLFPLFHYSLNAGGVLLLGSAETIGGFTSQFAPLGGKTRLFRRLDSSMHTERVLFPVTRKPALAPAALAAADVLTPDRIQPLAEQWLLLHRAPAAALVNEQGDILFTSGRTGLYLEPAAGKANWNLFAMAPEAWRHALNGAFKKVHREAGTPEKLLLRRPADSSALAAVEITVQFLTEPPALRGLVMVVFQPVALPEPAGFGAAAKTAHPGKREGDLRLAVQRAREEMEFAREEFQSTQEELKSTNEELQSTNEELQSTNEELTTSKEEMQSINEELQTVNAELQSKVDELNAASNDMKNLLNSTEIATVFLDNQLQVRRFTDRANKLFNFIPGDVGRPVTDLSSDLEYTTLAADCREVLEELVPVEKPVCTSGGIWFSMRIIPYRTMDDRINGVVLTFMDMKTVCKYWKPDCLPANLKCEVKEPPTAQPAALPAQPKGAA